MSIYAYFEATLVWLPMVIYGRCQSCQAQAPHPSASCWDMIKNGPGLVDATLLRPGRPNGRVKYYSDLYIYMAGFSSRFRFPN